MRNTIVKWVSRLRLALLGGALIVAGSSVAFNRLAEAKPDAKVSPVRLVVSETPLPRDGKISTSFAPVVKKVAPGVVKVFTTTKVKHVSQPFPPSMEILSSAAFSARLQWRRAGKALPDSETIRPRLGRHRHQRRLHPDQQSRRDDADGSKWP